MLLLVIYCLLILLASLVGGWIPLIFRLTHRRIQFAASLVAGVMLGVGLLHMLPHALLEAPDAMDAVFGWALIGFLAMFFVERFFCYHHHEIPETGHGEGLSAEQGYKDQEQCYKDQEQCYKDHSKADQHADELDQTEVGPHRLAWSGAAVGLTLHTIMAGIALAASVEAELHGSRITSLAGLGTFLVIFLHKPFDALTISTLMTIGGWSAAARHLVNALFALMIPLGAAAFYIGLIHADDHGNLVAYALAFSAGTFLCISMSDLLPELQFHTHDRGMLSATLLLGLSVAWVIGVIETQGHGHQHPPAVERMEHGEHAHENGH